MKRFVAVIFLASPAFGANVTITGSTLTNAAGSPLTGTVTFRPNNCHSTAVTLSISGAKFSSDTVSVTRGAFTALVPKSAGWCYQIGTYETSTGASRFVSGFGAFAPASDTLLDSALTTTTPPDTFYTPGLATLGGGVAAGPTSSIPAPTSPTLPATPISLAVASTSTLGGVKIGSGLVIASDGTLSAPSTGGNVAIGVVTTSAPGTSASATINGGVLNLTIPAGANGTNGSSGTNGLAPNLTMGPVTTLAAGAAPTATLSGTFPNLTLGLGIPSGGTVAQSTIVDALANVDLLSQGAIQAHRENYVDPATQIYDYPFQRTYHLTTNSDGRYGKNDSFAPFELDFNIGSGTEDAILQNGAGNNQNGAAFNIGMSTHGPIQMGGMMGLYVNCYGTDDCVNHSEYSTSAGTDRADNEGHEPHRLFSGPNNDRYGGTLALNGTDPFGHPIMRVSAFAAYDLHASASGRVLFDLSKKIAPAGNVASIARYSDTRFAVLLADSALTSAMASQFGSASTETNLVAGADNQQYNGSCPATAVSQNWPLVNGYDIDPYNDNPAGGGSHTGAMCLTVGSTAGMAAGVPVGFWGSQGNWEISTITRVVDGTHIIVPLNHPHDAGDLVTTGAGLGWGVSSPRNDYPGGMLSNPANPQKMTQHTVYPVMRVNGSNIELYTNSDPTGGQGEVHLQLYQSLVPAASFTFAPTVTNGVVTALGTNSSAGIYGDYRTTNPNLPGVLGILPPPALTYSASCGVVVGFPNAAVFNYAPEIVSGGSGCPSNLTITAQTTYTNPVVFYPTTKTYRVEDPNVPCGDQNQSFTHCPWNGYMKTHYINSAWANGDTVEMGVHWNYTIQQQESLSGNIDSGRSGVGGTFDTIFYSYIQSGRPHSLQLNLTPSSLYYGRASNNYSRYNGNDPAQTNDATVTPPVWVEVGGDHAGYLSFDSIPMFGQGTRRGGYVIRVGCQVAAGIGGTFQPPCARGIRPDYDLFVHDMSNAGGAYITLTVSDASNCIKINGKCIVTQ